jgi:hypothetical protein
VIVAIVASVVGSKAKNAHSSAAAPVTTVSPDAAVSSVAAAPPVSPVDPDVTVPVDLVGKTLGAATAELAAQGITQYSVSSAPGLQAAVKACSAAVTACGTLSVTSVDEAGQSLSPDDTVTIEVRAVIPPGGASSITQDGTYVVGKDIRSGTWHTTGQGDGIGCYWERDRNLDGDLNSIIANNNITGPTTVSVHKKDVAFQTSGGCTWTRSG